MIRRVGLALLGAACAAPPSPRTTPVPEAIPAMVTMGTIVVEPVAPLDRREAAMAAHRAGLMPLSATGIPQFAELSPQQDGRGVLIAILDSGIDPSVSGLDTTTDGRAKLIDLRDFSGEGRIPMVPVRSSRDTIRLGPARLGGVSAIMAASEGAVWAGLVPEPRFGAGAAADLNGNGVATDTLMVLVARQAGTWQLYADVELDGSLENDHGVGDYLVSRQWFGWSRAGAPPMAIAVNLSDSSGVPVLNLVFDNAGHGTHVAGIAAGHRLHGVDRFNGAAPGALLLGLKIANNAEGGITTTGSMRSAIAHAIAFARERRLSLVVNLSFGVGNQHEGTAAIDRVVDSILDANPDVVMTVAASNDGPGLSTLGFPASASRVFAVGATQPLVFEGMAPDPSRLDPVAAFSSRGGERSGPDVVAPGVAWSVVPRFAAGNEEQSGTSMAAPHVAGIVARLINVLEADGRRPPDRGLIHQALRATARTLPDATVLDQGAGLPDIAAAARWLQLHRSTPQLVAVDDADPTRNAVWQQVGTPPRTVKLRVRRNDGGAPMRIRVRTEVDWLRLEGSSLRELPSEGVALYFEVDSALAAPGVRVGSVLIEDADNEALGPLLRVPVTIRVPLPDSLTSGMLVAIHAGAASRMLFRADTGRGVRVEVSTVADDATALVALHEPGGQPFRDVPITLAGNGPAAAVIEIDARDVRPGYYEVVMLAPPTHGVAVRGVVHQSPVRLAGALRGDTLTVEATSLADIPVDVRLRAAFSGAEWQAVMAGSDARPTDTLVAVPSWARQLVVDVAMAEADWSRFTDFGVTLWRADGSLLAEEPLNYAFGRLRVDLPEGQSGDTLRLSLTPAATTAEPPTPWRVEVSVRFLPDRPTAIDRGGSIPATLEPGALRRVGFVVTDWPVPIPRSLAPLVTLIAIAGNDAFWTRELPLPTKDAPQ